MPKFLHKSKTLAGKVISGEISADNIKKARNILAGRNYKVLMLKPISNSQINHNRLIYRDKDGSIQINLIQEKVTTKELAIFTKQLSLMIENGIPLLQALTLLHNQQRKLVFKDIILAIKNDVEQGSSLSDSLLKHDYFFDQLYVAMIKAGEASGRLDIILNNLTKHLTRVAKLKSQLKSALMYPLLILIVAISVISFLLVFVVPSFASQFSENGADLPTLTVAIIDVSDYITSQWLHILSIIAFFILSFKMWYKSDKGRENFDKAILKAPLVGDIITKISISRFCSTMSIMVSSGVSILEALKICAASSGNKQVENFVYYVREEVSQGQSFGTPLEKSTLFPPMVSSMVSVGEATGSLDESLAKVTEIYEDEVDTSITSMVSMIEPLMILIIGSIVAFILLAMYLPVFDMANTIGS